MNAGDLTDLATFYQPVKATNANGKRIQDYQERFSVLAGVIHLRGSEAVMQARLASKSPAIVTIYNTSLGRQVTSEWRVEIDGKTYEAKEDPRKSKDRAILEMLVERVG